jgi:adenylate cyclase
MGASDGLSETMSSPKPGLDLSALLGKLGEFTSSQVSDAVGIPTYKARRYWRAMGFPNVPEGEREFTSADVDALSTLLGFVNDGVLDERQAVELTRTLGRAAARLANSVAEELSQWIDAIGVSGPERLPAAREVAKRVFPDIEELLLYSWRRHLAVALKRRQREIGMSGPLAATTGFADLVGFTRLSRQLSDKELTRLVQGFESRVADLITSHGGRVIKSLGDEIFFVTDDPAIGANIALDLTEMVSRRKSIPGVRVGLEFGSVVSHAGDVFGDTVNLASRLTALAEPNRILIGPALAGALAHLPAYRLVTMPPIDVRGFGMATPAELRRSALAADDVE